MAVLPVPIGRALRSEGSSHLERILAPFAGIAGRLLAMPTRETRLRICFLVLASLPASLVVPSALGQLLQGTNPSHSFAPDKCGPADPSYIRTANETGGVPLFLQRTEAVKAMQLVRESTRDNVSTVLWASTKLGNAPQAFTIPVDATTSRITFTFSVDTKGDRLLLRQPNGQEVSTQSSASIEDTELNCGRIVTIDKPEPGIWHAQVSGSGTYWLEAKAQSDINIIAAEFVELRGRPGHQGLFRIYGQPIVGETATLRVSLSADEARSSAFALVSERGDVLEKVRMKADDSDHEEFFGDLQLPAVPFRVQVTGRDSKGTEYQRYFSSLFHAETVQVTPKLDFDEIAAGEKRDAVFALKNLGPARSFRITVTDSRRFANSFEPREVTIDAHATSLLHVHLDVPAGTSNVFEDNLVVVAASTSGPSTTNSAVVRLSVTGNTKP